MTRTMLQAEPTATESRIVPDANPIETAEWLEALDQIVDEAGPDRVRSQRLASVLLGKAGPNPLGMVLRRGSKRVPQV